MDTEATIKIEYDPARDLLYLWFDTLGQKVTTTVTATPSMHVDFDATGSWSAPECWMHPRYWEMLYNPDLTGHSNMHLVKVSRFDGLPELS